MLNLSNICLSGNVSLFMAEMIALVEKYPTNEESIQSSSSAVPQPLASGLRTRSTEEFVHFHRSHFSGLVGSMEMRQMEKPALQP